MIRYLGAITRRCCCCTFYAALCLRWEPKRAAPRGQGVARHALRRTLSCTCALCPPCTRCASPSASPTRGHEEAGRASPARILPRPALCGTGRRADGWAGPRLASPRPHIPDALVIALRPSTSATGVEHGNNYQSILECYCVSPVLWRIIFLKIGGK